MLGDGVKGREADVNPEGPDGTKMYGQGEAKGVGMAAKRGKSGLPQSAPRGELKVYRAGSGEGRLPVPSNLRKQRSLTNLAVLTDAEKKMHLYEPKWCDDMDKPRAGSLKTGKPKGPGGGSGSGNGGGTPLSRNLSKSEHSLFQGKPKPFSALAAPTVPGKGQSRIPRGPYAEVKPLSKSSDDGKSDDDILSSKAKAAGNTAGPEGKGPAEEGGDKPFLKVDPELVVTVLGDLEQLLFSQMLDPESQRKRTVQNVLDLRQNLEDTMSSLRGTQIGHGCLDSNACYDSDETNARSVSSLSNRSSPLSWRHGQSSPRLQAGDAPSSTGGGYSSGKGLSQFTSHTMPARCSTRLSQTSRIDLIEGLDADGDLKSGYLSESDLLSKNTTTGDWDESSSISSGLSDGSDNLSSEDLNASSSLNSLPTTPTGSRRNSSVMLRTDAEKRSLVESGLAWYSADGKSGRKLDAADYDTGSLKTELSSRWKKSRPLEGSSQEKGDRGELRKPQILGQPGGFRKGRNPPVGVTSPITHTSQSVLKVAAPKTDCKATDKVKLSVKTSGLQRSCSDAGRNRGEHRKPPSGLVKPSAGGSFGYKKPPPTMGTATVMTAGGSTIISGGSATVGKVPKTSGIPIKPVSGGGGRKNSLDASGEDGFMSPNARSSIQYRSLPRPAKSSAMSLTGRPASRPVSSSIDAGLLTLKPVPVATPPLPPSGSARGKEQVGMKAGALKCASLGPVNQTDREKEKERAKAKADLEGSPSPHTAPRAGAATCHHTVPSLSESPCLIRRLLSSKSLGRPPSLAHLDKLNCNSLDSCITVHDLPPKIPPYSKLQDLAASSHPSPRLTPSPAPVLHIDSPSCFSGQALSLSSSPLLYPKMSALHRSMESLPLHMSVSPCSTLEAPQREDGRGTGTWGARSEGKERRHSHNVVSLTESESPPQLPSPTHLLQPFPGKAPPTNVGGKSRVLTTSRVSAPPQQIRKLRRELEFSQEKVACLTTQLSENANLVAAFEQSLALMTSRLQSLSVSSDQKDTELLDLRETIDILKTKNTEAQAIIQGALNNPETTPKELQINRQNSSESISSLNSITSHSSVGSLKEQDAKKKKKKSWLRSSFNKAFSKKGSKLSASYADIEEIATPDSSVPSSPKLHHDSDEPLTSLKTPASELSSCLAQGAEGPDSDEKVVSELRSELWEKERKLTDIRLEALSSAHQLEQLQETLTNMQMTVENLKAENDQLKTSGPSSRPTSSTSQSSGLTSLASLSPRQSVSMSKTLSVGEGSGSGEVSQPFISFHLCLWQEVKQQDFFIGAVRIAGRTDWAQLDAAVTQAFRDYLAKVDPTSSLGLSGDSVYSYSVSHYRRVIGGEPPETAPIRCTGKGSNCITVALKGLKEKCVDFLVFETLIPKPMMQHYISLLLKHRRIVLSGPSGTGKTYLTHRLAEYLVERSGREATEGIVVTFNMHRQSCKDLQLYLSNLANQIDRETSTAEIPLVVVLDDLHDAASISELVNGALTCKYHKCPYIIGTTNQPVKMTPNHGLHLSFRMVTFSNNVEPANGFLVRYLHRKLIEAEDHRSLTNEDLLRVLDWVPKLWYHLHAFLEKHSTSDFLIGPCFFLSCPVTVEDFRAWFIDLWNHSIIPYLQEGAKDGIKVHGQKAVWEDPVEWVRGTLPWPSAQQDQAKLFHLPPPSTGPSSPGQPSEDRPHKETPPSSMESDPLVSPPRTMLQH
uniref:Neuron navigator 1 n=1 Tax=Denticeps clupeoides TaxID=299321 RepID=A0AAY4EGX7_9TELE